MYDSFEEWMDIFLDRCHELGYEGPIDRDCFMCEYEDDMCPYKTAESFVDEMNS